MLKSPCEKSMIYYAWLVSPLRPRQVALQCALKISGLLGVLHMQILRLGQSDWKHFMPSYSFLDTQVFCHIQRLVVIHLGIIIHHPTHPGDYTCNLQTQTNILLCRCAEEAPLAQVAKKGGHFRCPQHYCATCGKSGDGVDMVKCIRCPTAYHSMCMNALATHRLHPQSKVILCEKHGGIAPTAYVPPPASPAASWEMRMWTQLAF